MNMTYLNLSVDKCMWILSKMPNANAYIDYWLNGNVSFMRFLLKPHCTISFMCRTDFLEFYKMDTYIYMEITKDTRSTYFLWNDYFIPFGRQFWIFVVSTNGRHSPALFLTKVCLQTIKNSKLPTKPSDGWISSTYRLSIYFSLFFYVKDFIISRFTIP